MLDEVTMCALRKQTFEKLKGMRLVILEHALGNEARAIEFEKELQKLMDKRSAELMSKKGKESKPTDGNKGKNKPKKDKKKAKKGKKK